TVDPPDGIGDSAVLRFDPVVTQSALPGGFKPWTANQIYALVAQSSTTGSGTGMNISIAVDALGKPAASLLDPGIKESAGDTGTGRTVESGVDDQGSPTITVNQFGTGYQLGDIVTFKPPSDGADSIEGAVLSLGNITQLAGAKWTKGASFANVAASSTTGTG